MDQFQGMQKHLISVNSYSIDIPNIWYFIESVINFRGGDWILYFSL
jgi:hypothetical protein